MVAREKAGIARLMSTSCYIDDYDFLHFICLATRFDTAAQLTPRIYNQ